MAYKPEWTRIRFKTILASFTMETAACSLGNYDGPPQEWTSIPVIIFFYMKIPI